jgi:hypothetical protein
VAKTAQGLKSRKLRKKFVLPIESWFFTFFTIFFAHGFVNVVFNKFWIKRPILDKLDIVVLTLELG